MSDLLRRPETQNHALDENYLTESRDAVASACMVVCWQLTSAYINTLSEGAKPDSHICDYAREKGAGGIVAEATEDRSWQGSARALAYLQEKHHERFSYLFMITGTTTTQYRLKNKWDMHYYAVAQDKSGRFFAISPANYTNDSLDPLTTIIEGDDIEELVSQISGINGGVWPTGEQITDALSIKYFSPIITVDNHLSSRCKSLGFFVVSPDYSGRDACTFAIAPSLKEIFGARRVRKKYSELSADTERLPRSEINKEAEGAIADAMIVAYSKRAQRALREFKKDQTEQSIVTINPDTSIGPYLERSTAGLCRENSARTLAHLARSNSNLFSQMFLLESWKTRHHPFKNPDFSYHTYFVVKDIDGRYYAGSPANHPSLQTSNLSSPLKDLLLSDSLQDIIDSIEDKDGGSWPLAEDVEAAGLGSPLFCKPQITESDGYCSVTGVCVVKPTTGGVDARVHTDSFKVTDLVS